MATKGKLAWEAYKNQQPIQSEPAAMTGNKGQDAWQAYRNTFVSDYNASLEKARPGINYVNNFLSDTNAFYNQYNRDLSDGTGFDAADFFESRKKMADDLKARRAQAESYLQENQSFYSETEYKKLMDSLANFDTDIDNVLGYYQNTVNAQQGYQAFMDDYNAYQDRVSGIQGEVMLDPSVPESALFAPIIDWMRGQRSGVTDQWTDDQKYQLGMMQLENPEEAQKYAREVNAGRDSVQEWQETEGMKTADLNVLQQELDALEDRYWNYQYDASTFRGRMAAEADLKQMEQEISERQRYLNQAKQVQEGEAYTALQENADFGEKSVYASPRQPIQNANISNLFTQTDPLYEYINNVGKEGYASGGHGPYADAGYDRMTDDEVAIFNYLYATEGRESARRYLDIIQETLNARIGQEVAQKYAGKPLKSIAYSLGAGAWQGLENVANLVNVGDYIPTSATAYAAAGVRDNMGGFYLPDALGGGTIGQAAFDVANTTGNMLPAMAVGMFNPTAGAVMLGASAAGNAYQEALNSGYTKEQARAYSTLVGASEVVLEKVLGGITAIGGAMIPNKIINKIVSGFDNALPRAAIAAAKLGGSMVSEGIEEGIQEALAPYIKNMTLLTDESVNWEEVAYSSLLGALSGGVMEAPGTVIDIIGYSMNQRRAGDGSSSGSSSGGSVSELTQEGIQSKVSADGRGRIISTNTEADANDFHSIKGGEATIQLKDGSSVPMDDMTFPNQEEAARFLTIRSLPGIETEAANDLYHAMKDNNSGSDVDTIAGVRDAYEMGYYGFDKTHASQNGTDASKLSPKLRNAAFEAGQKQRSMDAAAAPQLSKAPTVKPSKGYKKVVFEGKVNIAKGTRADAEVRFMDYIAQNFSGSAVHVYQSRKGVDGKRYYFDANGKRQLAPNGRYENDELWIDLNSGDKGEGLALNTFAHEMYHHVEKWNKKGAHKLAEFVVKELGMESVESAVSAQIKKATAAGYGVEYFKKYGNNGKGMTEEQAINIVEQRAMSDFVADALETMFTRGNPQEAIARLKQEDRGLFDQIKAFIDEWVGKLKQWYSDKTISEEGKKIAEIERFEELQKLFMEAMAEAGSNYNAAVADQISKNESQTEMSNEEAFEDSATAVMNSIRPPYSDGSRAFEEFAARLNPEAAKTFKLFYGFYQRSRITNTVSVSGKKVKKVNISSLYLLAQDWNDMLSKEPKWAAAAKDLADFLPADVRKRMNMNEDGSLNPTTMEKEFKMPSSMAQRLVDALAYETIDAKYQLGDKTVTLPEGKARQSVGGEAYRRAILNETRKLYNEGKLKPVGIGTMSKDRWGSLGFLAANGKTGASGDFTTVCPQMMFNRGCWYCYRRAAMEKGVNNKLVANSVWYTGEILRIKDSDITALNKNGGLRIQSFGDWMPHFSAMLADVLYDAELRGLQVKIITKEPSMINYIAALREQGIGKNLYFNLSADYTIERGPAKQAQGGDSLDTVNPERPFMRTQDNSFWRKRAMTVEEAAKYREKYPWVNTRIVATDVAEFIRGLKDNRVDVVTGYHGNLRDNIERIDSTTGERKLEVEALGDAGMPRFAFNPATGQWFTEYEGKTATHKNLAKAIADNGLQWEYYIKTCCITGRCATCEGKCGKLARDFNVKNATNRDAESVAYWQKQMEYAEEPEFGDLTDTMFSIRNNVVDVNGKIYSKVVKPGLTVYQSVKHNKKDFISHLKEKIYKRKFNVVDASGKSIQIEFAGPTERVRKDGTENFRIVRGELEETSDRLKMIAIINIKDLVSVSTPLAPNKQNNHQWLDTGGWHDRVSYMQDNDIIYPVIIHIPKTKDGRYLLYDVSVIKEEGTSIDINATALAAQSARASETKEKGFQPAVKVLEPSTAESLTQPGAGVKNGMNSLRNTSGDIHEVRRKLADAFDSVAKTVLEKKRAGEYREKIARAEALDSDLKIANREIMELGKAKTPTEKARHSQLRRDINRMRTELDEVNKQIRQIEILKSFRDQTQSVTSQYSKSMLQHMREMQKENIQQQILADRITREELTGKDSDITIMEKEFIRIAKAYEKLDAKSGKKITDLRNALKAAAKGNREMEKKFNQLLEDYEASGRKIQQLEETIARQRATAKARVESRRNTELRNKIQRKADELNRLLSRPTKHRNIPEYLQPTIAEIMKSINMEVKDIYQRTDAFEATMARYTKQIMMASTPEEAERLIQKRNEYAAKGDQFTRKMEQLQKVYQQIQDGADSNIKMDEGLYAHLMRLFVEVGDTPLGKMTSAQLEAVNDVLKITKATIVEANKLFQEGQRAGVEENSQSAMAEVRSAGGVHKLTLPVVGTVMEFSWNNLKPVYAMETIGSKVLKDLYENVRRGEDTLGRNLAEGKAFFQKQWKEYGGRDWDMEKKYRFESTSGKEFQLDLNQIMSIYALSKREQARSHLRNGGFSFESRYKTKEDVKVGPVTLKVGMESTDASAYNLSDEILGEIISKLSPQQRAFVDKMQGYLSNEMAAKGNEISLKKYGIRLFKEQNYFPLRVADQYMAKKREQQTGDRKLKNSGFTKEVTPEAKNPVVLGGFLDVWGEHVDEMSMYNAFVLPLDDFERVLNYHGQFTENGEATSVVEAIRNAYGEGATRYLDNLIRDINGGARTDSVAKSINRMTSKAKKAQTMASLSVAIQQPSAVIRAMAMVDGKYFIGPKVTEMNHGRTWEEMKKYAPITIIKEMGGFDTNVGQSTVEYLTDRTEYNGFMEKAEGFIKDEKYRDEVLGWLPGYMDELAWGAIWNAVKREQREIHPDMNHSGDAFLKIVANRFTDVVTHTQVYDSVFSRSGMMRSKDTAVKMVTSFMAEPTTTANMLYSALVNAKRGGGKAQLGRTVAALAGALVLNSALVSLVYAMRDDEEDKRYDEKWIENFRENVLEGLNPATYIPIIRDINSMRQGFDIERSDMSLYGDLMNAINGLTDENRSAWEKVETVMGATGNLLGIPVKNIIRDGKGLFNTIGNAMDHDDPATRTGRVMAWTGQDLKDGDQLLLAIQRGDEEHIQRVAGRYEDQDAAERALTTAIGNQYREGKLTAEEVTELLGTNTGMDADDIYWKLDEWSYARDNGSSDGYLEYGKLVEAIESGNSAEEIQRYLGNGADAGTVRSQITKAYKNTYMEGDEDTRMEIRDKVRPAYESLGTDDVDALFNDWDFEAQYGMKYSDYKAAFLDGDVSESQLRGAMDSYGRMQFQIEEDIRDLKKEKAFRDRFHMSLTEMYEAYDHGDIAKNTLISALEFSGKTREEAKEAVTRRDIENRMGIDYMKLDDAYKWGDITRQELYNAILENGATKQEADEAIVGYDWLKKNVKRYPDLTISDAKKFVVTLGEKSPEETLSDYGVSVDAYLKYQQLRPECKGVDANGDGNTDDGTLRDSVFRMIDSLPISDEAKDGLALMSYSMSSIKKNAPWH